MKIICSGSVLADEKLYENGKVYDVDEKTAKSFPQNFAQYSGDKPAVKPGDFKSSPMAEKTIKKDK